MMPPQNTSSVLVAETLTFSLLLMLHSDFTSVTQGLKMTKLPPAGILVSQGEKKITKYALSIKDLFPWKS
jgi:hypothetical protein